MHCEDSFQEYKGLYIVTIADRPGLPGRPRILCTTRDGFIDGNQIRTNEQERTALRDMHECEGCLTRSLRRQIRGLSFEDS